MDLGTLVVKIAADMKDFSTKMSGIGTSAGNTGKKLSLGLTAPIVALGTAAVATATSFEKRLVNAFSVTGSNSDEVKGKMEDLAREMGANTAFSANEAADAMYYMASAGWKADDMANALQSTLELAGATQSDLAFTTDAVVATLNQFQMGSEQAGRVADVFANAISNSQANMDKLKTSMGYIAPEAKILNWSLEDTTAALMALYNKGADASTAGTSLRMALAKLLKPTDEAVMALKNLGLSVSDVDPRTHSLKEIIGALEGTTLDAKDAVEIFGIRGKNAILNLVSTGVSGLEAFRGNLDKTGSAADMYAKQMDTMSGQMAIMKSALQEAAIAFGKVLLPAIRDIVTNHITPFIKKIGELDERKKRLIITIAAVAAAIGPLLVVVGKMSTGFTAVAGLVGKLPALFAAITSPVGLVIAALTALVVVGVKIVSQFKLMTRSAEDWSRIAKEADAAAGRTVGFEKFIAKAKEAGFEMDGFTAQFQKNKYDINKTMDELMSGQIKNSQDLVALYHTMEKESEAQKNAEIERKNALIAKEAEHKAQLEAGKLARDAIATANAAMTMSEEDKRLALEEINGVLSSGENLRQVYIDKLEETRDRLQDELTAQVAAKEALVEFENFLKENGILTIDQQNAAVADLEEKQRLLEQAFEDGKISAENYEKAQKALKDQINEVTGAEQSMEAFLKEEGIPTIADMEAEIETLEEKKIKLKQAFDDGTISLITYREEVEKVDEKLNDLAVDTMEKVAIPKARDLGDVVEKAMDQGGIAVETFKTTVDEKSNEISTAWEDFTDGLKTKWAEALSDSLSGATSFKDAVKGVWSDMKEQFFDIVGQMISKFIVDFIGGALDGVKDLGSSILSDIGGALSSIFTGGSGEGGGGGLAGNALSTLQSAAANFSPAGIIGSVAGGIVSGLGSLVAGDKTKGAIDATNRALEHIWTNTQNLENAVLWNVVPILDTLKHTLWNIEAQGAGGAGITGSGSIAAVNEKLINTNNILRDNRSYLQQIKNSLKSLAKAQFGFSGRVQSPSLMVVHPNEFIDIRPDGRLSSGASGSGGVNIVFSPTVNAIDAKGVRDFMRGPAFRELREMLRKNVNGLTVEISNNVGRY